MIVLLIMEYILAICLILIMLIFMIVMVILVVGIVMVIALLTLPAAVAGHFSNRMWQMMLLAILCSALFTTLGLAISYTPNLPAGATIIVLAGAVYLAVTVASRLIKVRQA